MTEEYLQKLKTIKNNDVSEFSLKNKEFICKVVDIYDGDTCKIIFYDNSSQSFIKYNCRLIGIDTPEIKPLKTKENRESEITKAKQCRNKLISLCCKHENVNEENYKDVLSNHGNLVKIICHDFDKYGRLLVEIFSITEDNNEKNISFNDILINDGLAKAYDGGKKI
jgi:endonuclease YncB( thermonuclease family)